MLAGDGKRRQAIGGAARSVMLDRFDASHQGERLRALIRRIHQPSGAGTVA
jgi:hypothetical protein